MPSSIPLRVAHFGTAPRWCDGRARCSRVRLKLLFVRHDHIGGFFDYLFGGACGCRRRIRGALLLAPQKGLRDLCLRG
jgi:hypothetical protein